MSAKPTDVALATAASVLMLGLSMTAPALAQGGAKPDDACAEQAKTIETQTAEIERLKKQVEELEDEIDELDQ